MSRGVDGRQTATDYSSSRRRCLAAASTDAAWRRPLFPGRLRVANQQSAAAKGNPLFSTPIIISIRWLARPSLAMILTLKWRRGEGKTNVGCRRQGQNGEDGTSKTESFKQEAVGLCCLSLIAKETNHLSTHVKGATRVSKRNANTIKVAATVKRTWEHFILILAKLNLWIAPPQSESNTESKVTSESP